MREGNLILVIAGHYSVSEDYSELSHLAKTEVNSLRIGIKNYQHYLKLKYSVRLVIWINDIGLTPLERKQYQQFYTLPDNYTALLKEAAIPLDKVVIRFESQSRNRASKLVRQLKRQYPEVITELASSNSELKRCINTDLCEPNATGQTVLTIDDGNGFPLVIKEGGAAKCCAILALFFTELAQTFQPIKIIGVFNFLYVERIKAGLYVAQSLLDFNIANSFLFCDETRLIHSEEQLNKEK
ncbi:MAG: hypothetical protein GQ548_01655 [Methylophaga sp.]|nr:hypothetical protein [Methylophaga sp.]